MPLDYRGNSRVELLVTLEARDKQLRQKRSGFDRVLARVRQLTIELEATSDERDALLDRVHIVRGECETRLEALSANHEALVEARKDAEDERDDAHAQKHTALRMFEDCEKAIRRLTGERDEARRQNGAKSGELFRFSAQVNNLKKQLAGTREAMCIEAYACDRAWAELENIHVERELAQKRWSNTQLAFAKAVERLSYPPLIAYPHDNDNGCECYCTCAAFTRNHRCDCDCTDPSCPNLYQPT